MKGASWNTGLSWIRRGSEGETVAGAARAVPWWSAARCLRGALQLRHGGGDDLQELVPRLQGLLEVFSMVRMVETQAEA